MQKKMMVLSSILISTLFMTGCVSSKTKVFGEGMPTMKAIHDEKFNQAKTQPLVKPQRPIDLQLPHMNTAFQWLPNPTLTLFVFPHLTASGLPVPGYTTFFRLYTEAHVIESPTQMESQRK